MPLMRFKASPHSSSIGEGAEGAVPTRVLGHHHVHAFQIRQHLIVAKPQNSVALAWRKRPRSGNDGMDLRQNRNDLT
jgi:hypothetical protein